MITDCQRVGETTFPGRVGRPLRASLYEWTTRRTRGGVPCRIRFISPDEEDFPRKFFVQALREDWISGNPGQYLDKACSVGYDILASANRTARKHARWYRLAQALFRNRNAGHLRIAREFGAGVDFLDFTSSQPGLVVPGLDPSDARLRNGEGLPRLALRLIESAVNDAGQGVVRERPGFSQILGCLELLTSSSRVRRVRNAPAPSSLLPSTLLPLDTENDGFFLSATDWFDVTHETIPTMNKVRCALIGGPVSEPDWSEAFRDPELLRSVVKKLRRSASERSPKEFDSWLRNVREHRFLGLVSGATEQGLGRDLAGLQAQRIYCALLWLSYLTMARCYGILMSHVLADLHRLGDLRLTESEKWLFVEQHLPRPYLGHVPLDFLGRHQMRWIVRTITPLLNRCVRQQEAYRPIADLLGVFGEMVRYRRETDSERKRLSSARASMRGDERDFDRHSLRRWCEHERETSDSDC
jgi:hypothetical protein